MADFRKWIPLLAVVALIVGAVPVNAQTFQCTANAGVTPLVRAEGMAEMVGDLLLNCSGTVPVGGIASNVRIFANTAVTSKLAGSSNTLPQASEALLLINDPGAASQVYRSASSIDNSGNPNVFQGTTVATNIVDWYSIPMATASEAGTTVNKTIRITNIRANAAQLGVSATLIPQPVQLSISISGATSVGINNPTQTVAWIQKSLTASIATLARATACETSFKWGAFEAVFREGFASAFKARGTQSQTEPGVSYNTESGLTPVAAPELGYASQGTRFIIQLTNVPEGTTVYSEGGSVTSSLVLNPVEGADSSGAGGTITGSLTSSATITNGTAQLVYEVVSAASDSISTLDVIPIILFVFYPAEVDLTTGEGITAYAMLAPVSTVATASYTAPVPRFQETSPATGVLTVEPCRTVLLFPYVTNAGGFDTGIAITNSSKDPIDAVSQTISVPPIGDIQLSYGSIEQSGTCQLNYYGAIPATGGAAPSAVTTPEVGAGEQLAFVLSSGGSVVGTDKTCPQCATPGFHGYVIAVCNFQLAHGFAFVSDMGSAKLAEGYLALVIPENTTRKAQAFSLDAVANGGEQIVF